MAMAFGANKQTLTVAPAPVLARFGRRLLAGLREGFTAPEIVSPPRGVRVSERGWKRNSALVMSFYDQNGR